MNLYHNMFNKDQHIIDNIKLIYESLSINKALFIIESTLFSNIFQRLEDAQYPICTSKNFNILRRPTLYKNFQKKTSY